MKKIAALAVLVALPAAAGLVGAAEDEAIEILKKSDEFHYGYGDSHLTLHSLLKDKDGATSEIKYEMWEKGEKRLLVFQEPPDLTGTAVLVKDPDTIYVYEPEFNKVRRIAAHAKKQTMFGMDYSMDESALRFLHKQYDPKIESEDEDTAVLILEQKPGLDKAWPKLRVTVDKKNHWIASKIEYLDAKGKKHKTEVRKGVKTIGGRLVTSIMIMTDHQKKHSTSIVIDKAEYDLGLPEEMFTKRYLVREE